MDRLLNWRSAGPATKSLNEACRKKKFLRQKKLCWIRRSRRLRVELPRYVVEVWTEGKRMPKPCARQVS